MRSINIGKYVIPMWFIIILLISGIGGISAYYIWETVIMNLEVKEPLEILYYPSELSLFPGETEEFTVTVQNYASVNYSVILDFDLSNTTYQDNYVTFSNEIYTVILGQQNLTAWLIVESYAPSINASLTIDFMRTSEDGEVLLFDDFNDGVADGWTENLGSWSVIDGKYFTSVGIANHIATVDDLTLADCIIETRMRFTDDVGFRAGIVFRHADNQHYYAFEISNEYDVAWMIIYTPEYSLYGFKNENMSVQVPISKNVVYTLKVKVQTDTFTGYLDGLELFSWIDGNYTSGKVGLHVHRADGSFDNFTVTRIP